MRAVISACARGLAPSRRKLRLAVEPSASVPVPSARAPSGVVKRPETAQRPRCAFADPSQFVGPGAAQAAAGEQEGNGLEQIGLTAAVRPRDHDEPRRRRPVEGGVVAEVGEREAVEPERGVGRVGRRQTRIGIST